MAFTKHVAMGAAKVLSWWQCCVTGAMKPRHHTALCGVFVPMAVFVSVTWATPVARVLTRTGKNTTLESPNDMQVGQEHVLGSAGSEKDLEKVIT